PDTERGGSRMRFAHNGARSWRAAQCRVPFTWFTRYRRAGLTMLAAMSRDLFSTDISRHIWDSKYRYRDGERVHDHTLADTWHRVARALAAQEGDAAARWAPRFYAILDKFRFLPGGRILAG